MVRAPCFDKNGIKRGAWSKEEDNKLRAYIQIYGHSNWRELPKLAGLSRCGKSCRLRWMNYLRPNMKRGNFTKEEEDVIVGLHEKLGNKWSTMATQLPGRSDNEIKNHWHTHLKNQVRKDQTVLKIEQFETLEPFKATPRGCQQVKKPNLKTPQEVEILLAVLTSESPSSSSTSESSQCSLSVSDYEVPCDDATPQFSEPAGNLWFDQLFLPDNNGVVLSSETMFSPFGLTDDNLISKTSFPDHIMDDVHLWSTIDLYL
ncbi:unnamed protein product [Lactuca virosa]|uniref:Uncharacterized protein n=1 Tax=Lactuca virosa TaxID=75947 RepID=A0AAU9LK92_9ASTR|nr:unnamed protein product [Lactuca virosa]